MGHLSMVAQRVDAEQMALAMAAAVRFLAPVVADQVVHRHLRTLAEAEAQAGLLQKVLV